MFSYVQTHQIVHITHVQLFVRQLYLNKTVEKRVERSCAVKQIEGKERAN